MKMKKPSYEEVKSAAMDQNSALTQLLNTAGYDQVISNGLEIHVLAEGNLYTLRRCLDCCADLLQMTTQERQPPSAFLL